MADDVTLPGDGAVIATDDVAGRQFQLVKLAYGGDGQATQVSDETPMPMAAQGELIEAIEAMRMAVQSLARTMGQMQPDTAARMRVAPFSASLGPLRVAAPVQTPRRQAPVVASAARATRTLSSAPTIAACSTSRPVPTPLKAGAS